MYMDGRSMDEWIHALLMNLWMNGWMVRTTATSHHLTFLTELILQQLLEEGASAQSYSEKSDIYGLCIVLSEVIDRSMRCI